MNIAIQLRPSRDEDAPFIRRLFEEAETERLCMWNWDPEERRRVIDFEFESRQKHFQGADADMKECVLEVDGEPAGRMVVIQNKDHIRLADLTLLRAHGGKGIAEALVEGIKNESRASSRPVQVLVEAASHTLGMYQQLGFYQTDDLQTHKLLEWSAKWPVAQALAAACTCCALLDHAALSQGSSSSPTRCGPTCLSASQAS